jgi:hypothetical protein
MKRYPDFELKVKDSLQARPRIELRDGSRYEWRTNCKDCKRYIGQYDDAIIGPPHESPSMSQAVMEEMELRGIYERLE